MSNHTAVEIFLSRLFKCAGTISTTYYNTRVVKTDENATDIELLRQILDHGVQHQIPPFQRALRIGVGVQRAGGLY